MIADSIKGKEINNFPAGITKGILLHRAIDTFTDQHLLVKQTRKIFYPTIRHYSLVISDVIYDHFLGANWQKFSDEAINEFSKNAYDDLERNKEYLPEKFSRIFSYMKKDDWFVMYSNKEGIYATIERLSYRSKEFIWAKETIGILEDNYGELEMHFLNFFPELVTQCKKFLKDY